MASRPLVTFRIFWHRCPTASARSGFQSHPISSWRSFSFSAPRCKLSAKATVPPGGPARGGISSAGRRAAGLGKLATMVSRQGEVELYKAPSHRAYILSAYGVSALCFSWAIYHSTTYLRDTQLPLPTWQKGMFAGICVLTSAMGTLFFIRTSHLIKRITATSSDGRMQLNFTVRHLVPFMKPYRFQAHPSQMEFKRKLVLSPDSIKRYQKDQMHIGGDQGPPPKFFKAPVQTVSVSLWRLFQSVRQVFTSEDFIMLEVQGQKGTLRMDSKGFVAPEFLLIGDPVSRKNVRL